MSKKLGFNISDLLAKPDGSTTGHSTSPLGSSPLLSMNSSVDYQQDRTTSMTVVESNSPTVMSNNNNSHGNNTISNDSNLQLSNYEQLMRASSMYRNQEYSLLPIVNGTYPWIQTDSVLKDRFSCKFMVVENYHSV